MREVAKCLLATAASCLAVHRDIRSSKGTKGCVRRAIGADIPAWLVDSEAARPRPITLEDLD